MQRFGFLLIPGFSMLSLAAAVEPFRMANAQAEDELYQWDFLSRDNTSDNASNNMVTAPTIDVDQVKMLDVLLVVAGINVATYGMMFFLPGYDKPPVKLICWALHRQALCC